MVGDSSFKKGLFMAFKASRAKSGLFEIHGLELYIEQKVDALRKALGLSGKSKEKKVEPKVKKAAGGKAKVDPLGLLEQALDASDHRSALIKAGKQKDQLLRSLIPLYLSKGQYEVTSGTVSKFWAKHGVTFAAPNAAKALRQHPGNSKRTARGQQITAQGVKYVEAAFDGT
jgi:hypothetical protein